MWIEKDTKEEEFFKEFLELMPPAVIFDSNCLSNQLVNKALRDLLMKQRVEVRKPRGLTMMKALGEIYPDVDDRN